MASSPIVISSKVIDSVKALPESDRNVIVAALAEDLILGCNPESKLSPFQAMLYTAIHYYVCRDSVRASGGLSL